MPDFIQALYPHKYDYAVMAKKAMEGLPDHPEEAEYIYAYTCTFLHAAAQYEESINHCDRFLPLVHTWDARSSILSTRIASFEKLERFNEAIELRKQLLEECRSAEQDNIDYYIQEIAEAYEKAGDLANAVVYYEMYVETGQADKEVYEKLADFYDTTRNYEKSAACFLKAVQEESSDTAWLWNNIGRAVALSGKEKESVFYFDVSLKLDPRNADAHYYKGQIYQNENNVYMAMHHYMEALKTQPEFPAVHNNLAAIQYHEENDIRSAIEYLNKALEYEVEPSLLFTVYRNLSILYKKISDYDMHEYYNAKMLESLGFPVDFTGEEDDDEYSEDDDE